VTKFSIGDTVTVAAPFDAQFPDPVVVESIDEAGTAVLTGGWSFDDQWLTLSQAANGEQPVLPAIITVYAARQRFTEAEKVGIDLAAIDNPAAPLEQRQFAAQIRVWKEDMASVTQIDLRHQAVIDGVTALETAGLLAPGRAAVILNPVVQPGEAP